MDKLYTLYLCFHMNIQPACVLFHMCSQQRCDIPRGRAESWSTRQRGSWSNTLLNTPSILVMELLCFLPRPPKPSIITYMHLQYSSQVVILFQSNFSDQQGCILCWLFLTKKMTLYSLLTKQNWVRIIRRVSSVCNEESRYGRDIDWLS